MFNFIEKLIVKNVVKRLIKKLPKLKDKSNELLNVYGESLIEKVLKRLSKLSLTLVKSLRISKNRIGFNFTWRF